MSLLDDSLSTRSQQILADFAHATHRDASRTNSRPNSVISTESPRASDELLDGLPDYATAVGRASSPMTYKIVPLPHSSMVITQHDADPEAGAAYHISVDMNPFMPLNHVTTIHRGVGASCRGEVVGNFEMGVSEDSATLTVGEQWTTVDSVLSKLQGSRQSALWFWHGFPDRAKGLLWDTRKMPFMCISMRKIGFGTDSSTVATFTPAQTPVEVAELSVTPAGQSFFDEIILSLLIIERKRRTPSMGKSHSLKQLFH